MKLTNKQLKQIIKEELQAVMDEGIYDPISSDKEAEKALRNYLPMQTGDVHATLSDSSLLKKITGYSPKINYKLGIKKFISWYLKYYN